MLPAIHRHWRLIGPELFDVVLSDACFAVSWDYVQDVRLLAAHTPNPRMCRVVDRLTIGVRPVSDESRDRRFMKLSGIGYSKSHAAPVPKDYLRTEEIQADAEALHEAIGFEYQRP